MKLKVNVIRSSSAVILTVLTLAPAVAGAQAPTLRRMPGDTLRYHQTVTGTQHIEGGPMNGMSVTTETDNRFAVAFGAADTVRVWFEAASSKMKTPDGEMSAPLGEMLNKPYVMKLSGRGQVQSVSAPALGGDPTGLVGMMPQFWGFEMGMPREPMRVGLIWTDTVDHKGNAGGSNTVMRKVTTYRISRDSVLAGERIFVIETTGTHQSDVNVAMANNMSMKTTLRAEETGRIFFAPGRGVVLGRRIRANSTGTQSVSGPMEMSMNVTQKMETTLDLIR